MKIQLSQFNDGEHQIDFEIDATEYKLVEPFFGLLEVSGKLIKYNDRATLTINATCNGKFNCDRCLKEFEKTVKTNFVVKIILNDYTKNTDDDFNVYKIEQLNQMLDFSKDIKEYLFIAIPQKLLCNDECFGLCFQCGENLNDKENNICNCVETETNPTWDELKKIL